MDEILLRQLHGLPRRRPRATHYDLSIGDEAWEVDHFLHENPELKRAAYAWLTDFVGWLPMPDGGEREACLTADYNAEMIEHIARYPRVRDRSIFVGDAGRRRRRLVRRRACRRSASWTEEHFDFAGVHHRLRPRRPRPTATALRARARLPRRRAGLRRDRRRLGRRRRTCCAGCIDVAARRPSERVPGLRMVAVAGPRIDPASLPAAAAASRCTATCPTCTGTWPPATSPSSRAA